MNEDELKNLLGLDRYHEIQKASKEDMEAIGNAIEVLQKRFKTSGKIGYSGDDFIQNGYTLMIKLRPL